MSKKFNFKGLAKCNSPLNHSRAKQMYSFSRSPRFPPIDLRGHACRWYDIPENKETRYASLGKGERSDFTKIGTKCYGFQTSDSLAGGKTVNTNNQISFGLGREYFTKAVGQNYKSYDKEVPGPAKYVSGNVIGTGVPKYSIRLKCKNTNGNKLWKFAPGPGSYADPYELKSNGKYRLSTMPNVQARDFGTDKIDRFKDESKLNNNKINLYVFRSKKSWSNISWKRFNG